jgi:hypothetical protein
MIRACRFSLSESSTEPSAPQVRENHVQRFLATTVLECFDINTAGIFGAKMLPEYHFAADGVIVFNYPSKETNDDHRRGWRSGRRRWKGGPVMAWNRRNGTGCSAEGQDQGRQKREDKGWRASGVRQTWRNHVK